MSQQPYGYPSYQQQGNNYPIDPSNPGFNAPGYPNSGDLGFSGAPQMPGFGASSGVGFGAPSGIGFGGTTDMGYGVQPCPQSQQPIGQYPLGQQFQPFGAQPLAGQHSPMSQQIPIGQQQPMGQYGIGQQQPMGQYGIGQQPMGQQYQFGQQPSLGQQQPMGQQYGMGQQPPLDQQQPMGQHHGMGQQEPMGYTKPATTCVASGRPSIVPAANFDPGADAEVLKKAMRGLGTDCKTIILVLSKRTSSQRKAIAVKYKACYGKDLDKALKSELSGNFENVVLASIRGMPAMLADACCNAIKGLGTNELVLIQVIVPAKNHEIHEICAAYKDANKHSLEDHIRSDTSGDFCKILVALIQGCRDENTCVNQAQAESDAQILYEAGQARWGTEESAFIRILSQKSLPHIAAISAAYQKKYGCTLIKAIKKETSGYFEDTLIAIVQSAENMVGMFAEWIHNCVAGLGTKDNNLIRLVLTRAEVDMEDIKKAYLDKYGKTLAGDISGDTSGNYREMLMALIGASNTY